MPIYETLSEGLIMPSMNRQDEIRIPKDSLAYKVYQMESNKEDTHLRHLLYLLTTLKLERNRIALKTEPEALNNLFQLVDEIYKYYYNDEGKMT